MSGQEAIASRFIKLNQIILGKSGLDLPTKYLAHRDGLLDVLFALYEECNVDYMRKDKHIATFVDKFKGLMIELKSLRVNLRDFEVKKIIGRGHFGEVQVVREKATGDVYAMKILRKEETLLQQNVAFYKEERDIMATTTSPWLTKLQYAFQDSQNLYLVMEFHPGGDMLSLLIKYDSVLPEDMIRFYLAELVLAIHSLHTMGYVHRDIKPDNILIDRTGHIKLADFGSASKLNPHKQVTSVMPVGTPDYVAPEVLVAMNTGPASSKSYGIECDWWSLGIVTYEMVFGSTPFTDDKVLVTYNNIMNFKNSLQFPPEAEEVSKSLVNLIQGLLENAQSRLDYDQLVVHPFFFVIDWNNIRDTAPPYIPTVTSVDDTSNFDDFEPESRPHMGDFKGKKEFTGKNLPFVGFTFTKPFQTNIERLSSFDDLGIMSPSSSFCEPDSVSKRKEKVALQRKISQLSISETSLKSEIDRLKKLLEEKNKEVEKVKDEKLVLEQLTQDQCAEIQLVKQLLAYERKHRVITEQKAAQLVRCMKIKQKQDALRLRAKSMEFNNGERQKSTLEEQLDEALSKIDDFVREKAELLEDLEATKHTLLEIQRKVAEKEINVSSFDKSDNNSVSSIQSLNSSITENKSESETQDFRRLVFKLEKKNIQLEKDLENVTAVKNEKEACNIALQNTVLQLERKIKELEKQVCNLLKQNSRIETQGTICLSPERNLKENEVSDSKENSTTEETSGYSDDTISETPDSANLQVNGKKKEMHSCDTVQEVYRASVHLPRVNMDSIDFPSENKDNEVFFSKSLEQSEEFENIVPDKNGKKKSVGIEVSSNLRQENDYLKTRIETLDSEITKLKADLAEKVKSISNYENQLKEKDGALSMAKVDLRISARKEQQTESVMLSLRERNKELREKIKALEDTINEKTKMEKELKQKLSNLESDLSEKMKDFAEKEKLFEIEKAKHEEQLKAMRYTCEISKDVTQKFAKSQDHYEEIVKQNMDLIKEKQEENSTNAHLSLEIKSLRDELTQKENENIKLEKKCSILKTACTEMEEELEEWKSIVDKRERIIDDLKEEGDRLVFEIEELKKVLEMCSAEKKKIEQKNLELSKHIDVLTSEMDNNNFLYETEMQDVVDQLNHYKKMATDMEEQNALLQRELNFQNSDCRNYSQKVLHLESQLCEIKEEAARHITEISSLKCSNLKLTEALEDAVECNKEVKQENEDLQNLIESIKAAHHHEKVKMLETIAQQTKLIDFLQSKTENMEKKKKPHISRLFGKKEHTLNTMPVQFKDVEKSLETEKARCRSLQDQLSQARAEIVALQKEIHSVKNSTINVEVPVSPMSRAMHCVITQSPSNDPGSESPLLVSKDLVKKFSKPPGMKHKIPHRFTNTLCMRSSKCCACLDTLHFGRQIAKCQECSVSCHQTCAASLPNTCGLPSGFMQHFKTAVNSSSSANNAENLERLSEGWIKIPTSNKFGWDRRYLRLMDNLLCLFENADEKDSEKALIKLDISPSVAKMVVTSAVSATELSFAASSDLPFVFKLEYFPHTTCWPKRSLYIMAQNFSDKQMWVSTLEALAEENQTEIENCQKNKLIGKAVWTLKGDRLLDPLCTCVFDDNVVLLGTIDGLYVLKIVNKFSCSLKSKIDGLVYVYQIACLKNIDMMILIQGNERRLTLTHLNSLQSGIQKLGSSSLISKPFPNISDCHLFSIDSYENEAPYLCIATSDSVVLLKWDTVLKTFCNKKVFETKDPCCCIYFSPKSVIFGTDSFYELDLNVFTVKNFLDDRDSSLAGLIYGASQFKSFPVAIFQVSSSDESSEYLLCFHEMGVFVNGNGQRTRADDMQWSRLPLSFAYQLPYLFITHFNSVEVIEIPPQNAIESGLRGVNLIPNPVILGPAHLGQSIYLASCHDQIFELILVDGNSIGRSEFHLQYDDNTTTEFDNISSSEKESTAESDGLEFSFSTSMDEAIVEASVDQLSVSSKTSENSECTSTQS